MYSGSLVLRKSQSSLTFGSRRLAATMCAISAHVAHDVIPRQHDGGLDVMVLHQDVFDLLELDPVAADLHLMIDAPEKLKISVSAPAGEVSRCGTAALRGAA